MKYWNAEMPNASHFAVELNGKIEGQSCVEADSEEGWVRREWLVGKCQKNRKFYGRVFIVRVRGFI